MILDPFLRGIDTLGEDMSANWEVIYRNYGDEKLTAEIACLEKQLENVYSAQSTGNKSYQRDTVMLQGRLKAANVVKNERGASYGANDLKGCVDFGDTCLDDF